MKYFKNCLTCISYCIIFHPNYVVHKYTNIYVLKMIRKHTWKDVKHLFCMISGYHCVVKLGNYRQSFILLVHIFVTLVYIYLISMTKILLLL